MILGERGKLLIILDCCSNVSDWWGPKLPRVKEGIWSSFFHFITLFSPLSVTFPPLRTADFTFRGEICFSVWVGWWNPVKVCCLCLVYHSWPHLHQLLQHMDSRREPVQLWICHPSPVPIGQNKPWLKNESLVFAVCALHVFAGSLVLLYRKQEILQPNPHSISKMKENTLVPTAVGLCGKHQSYSAEI